MYRFVLALALCACASAYLAPLYKAKEGAVIPNKYIVSLHDGVSKADIIDQMQIVLNAKRLDGIVHRQFKKVINGFAADLPEVIVNWLRTLEEVEFIEEEQIYRADETWGLDRVDQADLPLDDSFTPRGTGSGANVYVIDTGINYDHDDFAGRAKYFDDQIGTGGSDCNGHGSHCAGTVGGATWGVAKSANLWAVRVLGCSGSGSTSGVVAGMDNVATGGSLPGVASMSLGGGTSFIMDRAVNTLKSAGFIVVVSAGNDNSDACNQSPARAASAITVGATDINDRRSSFSNYGDCVDIFAPGTSITSCWWTGTDSTRTISGTSMACPHVAGACAVLYGASPNSSPDDVETELLSLASMDKISDVQGSINALLYIGN
ncbi:aqualysin-1-like [Ptychodera flava]|uniref:aqualysin-1-like n=1 Tax=Ptychodera flava TaxID=63121 RepID=UPI00396A5545